MSKKVKGLTKAEIVAERVAQYFNHCQGCNDFLENSLLVYGLCSRCAKKANNVEVIEVKPTIIKL